MSRWFLASSGALFLTSCCLEVVSGQDRGEATGGASSAGAPGFGAGNVPKCSRLGAATAPGVATVAGNGGILDVDGSASSSGTAQIGRPLALTLDQSCNLFVAELGPGIRKIDSTGAVTTLTGSFGRPESPSPLAATALTVGATGDLELAFGEAIWRVVPGNSPALIAGTAMAGNIDGPGSDAEFDTPTGLAADGKGNLFVSETGVSRIRRIDVKANVATLAGGFLGDADGTGGTNGTARFRNPMQLTVDLAGRVYVADTGNNKIRLIDSDGRVTTIAGSGTSGFADGDAKFAQFASPTGIALSQDGVLYVADTGNERIRRIDVSGLVTTVAGNGTQGFADGALGAAEFDAPVALAIDSAGTLYVADRGNNRIRVVVP